MGGFEFYTQEDNSVFIDRHAGVRVHVFIFLCFTFTSPSHRDPEHFPRVLAFLRDGVVDDVPPQAHPSLLREAHFYSLDPLIAKLEVCVDVDHPHPL